MAYKIIGIAGENYNKLTPEEKARVQAAGAAEEARYKAIWTNPTAQEKSSIQNAAQEAAQRAAEAIFTQKSKDIQVREERRAIDMNNFIAQNPNASSLPTNLDPTGQYAVVNGVLTQKSAIAQEAANEAAVKAGTMKKVKIGNGYGYVPINTPDIKGGTGGDGKIGGAPGSGDSGTSTGGGIVPPPANSAFKNSAAYKGLSADEQALVDMAFSTFIGTEDQQRIFADALRQATEMADPYAKAQLALFRGEYESKIAYSKGDLERASEIITRTRDELSQDVSSAKEFLTLEQQAEIAQETTKYGEDLLTIADQAAEKGLTFATGARSRVLAEERRGAQFQDVIQSRRREFNFKTKELELKAARGDIDAQKKLADIRAKSSFQLEDIGRSAEKVLGSANVPSGTEYSPVGGVLGDVEQERRKSIIDIASLGLPK